MTEQQSARLEDETVTSSDKVAKPAKKKVRFSIPAHNKYADQSLKADVIRLWIEDMLEKDFGIKFNADIPYAKTSKGVLTGDASLYLAIRYAPQEVQDKGDLLAWLEDLDIRLADRKIPHLSSEFLINKFTGIPVEIANQLVNPRVLLKHPSYAMNKMSPREFATTLRNYLITGVVSWDWLLPYDGK